MDVQSLIKRMNATTQNWYVDWLYGGVDFNIEGNGGENCALYLPGWTRLVESGVMIIIAALEIIWGAKNLTFEEDCDEESASSNSSLHPSSNETQADNGHVVGTGSTVKHTAPRNSWPCMKRALLVFLCMVFGIEIGYKFATKSLIYLLNPCHMVNFMQIYLLASDHQRKSKIVNTVFRIHLYLLNGPFLALIFYVVNTRFLPFEQAIYWIQHILLYLVPIYMISLGGSYTPDPISGVRWAVMSTGVCAMYHFLVLQILGLVTWTNLNNMLCPAISDPFKGEHYRKWACTHQHLLIILHGKLYVLLARFSIRFLSAVQSFCVALTVKTWEWTIYMVVSSAKACVRIRSTKCTEVEEKNGEPCVIKTKVS